MWRRDRRSQPPAAPSTNPDLVFLGCCEVWQEHCCLRSSFPNTPDDMLAESQMYVGGITWRTTTGKSSTGGKGDDEYWTWWLRAEAHDTVRPGPPPRDTGGQLAQSAGMDSGPEGV